MPFFCHYHLKKKKKKICCALCYLQQMLLMKKYYPSQPLGKNVIKNGGKRIEVNHKHRVHVHGLHSNIIWNCDICIIMIYVCITKKIIMNK